MSNCQYVKPSKVTFGRGHSTPAAAVPMVRGPMKPCLLILRNGLYLQVHPELPMTVISVFVASTPTQKPHSTGILRHQSGQPGDWQSHTLTRPSSTSPSAAPPC